MVGRRPGRPRNASIAKADLPEAANSRFSSPSTLAMVNTSSTLPLTVEISPRFSNRSRLMKVGCVPFTCSARTVPPDSLRNKSSPSPKLLVSRAWKIPPPWLTIVSSASSMTKPKIVPELKIFAAPGPRDSMASKDWAET
jgi:hypothetical protein